jgi:hypothetical protein
MICFSDLQFAMMGTAEEVIELISKGLIADSYD